VGIGTTSPANPTGGRGVEVSNSSGASFRLTNSATYLDFQSGGSANYILSNGAYPLLFYTNSAERMRLDSSGNLGIGTSSPVANFRLTTSGSADTTAGISIQNTSTGTGAMAVTKYKNNSTVEAYMGLGSTNRASYAGLGASVLAMYTDNSAGIALSVDAAGPITFNTNSTERARITSGGNLLVGSTAQIWDEKALVTNSTNTVILGVYGTNASYTSSAIRCQVETAAGTGWYFFEGRSSGGTFQYGIRGNGTVATSDERRKKNIEPARSYLEDICKIPVIKYNWKSDNDGAQKELGWLAQDVQKVFPSMVVTHHDGPNDDQEVLLLKKEVFLPMLMKCIQEQQALIQSLKARLDAANL
jgi:hypothetical protein